MITRRQRRIAPGDGECPRNAASKPLASSRRWAKSNQTGCAMWKRVWSCWCLRQLDSQQQVFDEDRSYNFLPRR